MPRSRISEDQIKDVDNMSETEHDAWTHVNLVCSGTVTIDAPVMVSGAGDIYCKDLHTEDNSIYIGSTKLSASESGSILIDDEPLTAEAETVGYTGAVPIVSSVTTSGIVNNSYLIYENGLLTTVSGAAQTEISASAADGLLSIM